MSSPQEPTSGGRFVKIGKDIHLATSQNATVIDGRSKDPTVILIFGWMSAKLPHLFKYTQAYEKLYPGATQILVQSPPSFFWSSQKSVEIALSPVVEALEALGCIPPALAQFGPSQKKQTHLEPTVYPPANHRILVQAFSNGGASQLVTLSRILSQRPGPSPHFASCIIFDSCPGTNGLKPAIKAFTTTIRNPVVKYFTATFLVLVYWYLYITTHLLRRKDMLTVLRDSLKNPKLLPWVDKQTPRLYLFSRRDELIPWKAVERHAAESEAAGIPVQREMFARSGHVAHAKDEPERYWKAIEGIWEKAR